MRGRTPSPPAMGARAAGALADAERLDPHREAPLENLRIGQAELVMCVWTALAPGDRGVAPAPPQSVS